MPAPDRKRLARLQRLEKVRAVARQTAAAEAAAAEGTLAQLLALADRTRQLASGYAARRELGDGSALRQLTSFRAGLDGVARGTTADAGRARALADRKLTELAEAERRRQAAETRAIAERRALAGQQHVAPLTARRALGTDIE
ncbi:MAG: hypothetical protein V4579_07910 [Pseudomonadota bacterium]